MNKYKKKIVLCFYKLHYGIVKKIIEKYIIKKENGEYWSETLRFIYQTEYDIKIGIGSYGCFKKINSLEGL